MRAPADALRRLPALPAAAGLRPTAPADATDRELLGCIAQRLVYWREQAGLDRRELARRLGGAEVRSLEQRLYRAETGRSEPSVLLLVRTAAALDLPVEALLATPRPLVRLHLLVHRLPPGHRRIARMALLPLEGPR